MIYELEHDLAEAWNDEMERVNSHKNNKAKEY